MKRSILVLLTLCFLLTACGAEAKPGEPGEAAEPPEMAPVEQEAENRALVGLSMEMERAVYDPSVTRYTYFIRNNSAEAVEFGEGYFIQKRDGDQWKEVEWAPHCGVTAIGYHVEPGGVMALDCSTNMLAEPPSAGKYRLVKEVGGHTLYAEFELGESPYTAETPYGFVPLEELPLTYNADTAEDGDVIFTGSGAENMGAVEEFLWKVGLGVSCQLRTVQDYGEGAVLVTDVIYEELYGSGYFLWRQRQMGTGVIMLENADESTIRSATLAEAGFIMEKRFSYLVTDGESLYLSNGADWESTLKYGSDTTFLLPEPAGEVLVSRVEDMTASRLEGNITRYAVWSSDGRWSAGVMEDGESSTEFYVSHHDSGIESAAYDLQNWDGLETAITGLAWQADGTLLLVCDTVDGGTSWLAFDPETQTLR